MKKFGTKSMILDGKAHTDKFGSYCTIPDPGPDEFRFSKSWKWTENFMTPIEFDYLYGWYYQRFEKRN